MPKNAVNYVKYSRQMLQNPYLLTLCVSLCYFIAWYFICIYMQDNSIVDIIWGTNMILNVWLLYYFFELPYGILLPTLVTASQSRLSLHIFTRKRNKKEDWRYANWRNSWGSTFLWRSFLQIFCLQGFLNWVMILPIMDLSGSGQIGIWQYLGIAIWFLGTSIESIGDYQLSVFKQKRENAGKIMMSGLWNYSRHPNYLGQIIHWIGIFLIMSSGNLWYYSILSPILITILINWVSGVPMLEKKYDDNPTFQRYKERVPALVPRIF